MDICIMEREANESTREYVYRCIKENIMQLRLIPGSVLSEKDIAALLNVSRTPVREAFIQLSKEYLLDIIPQKGTYVSLIDLDHVDQSLFLRETVEKEVIALACQDFPTDKLFELQSFLALQQLCIEEQNYVKFFELDEQFHQCIFEGCRKARIWSLIQQMSTHYNRVRILNVAGKYDRTKILQQHQAIVQAIREKNVALGRNTASIHLNKVRLDIKDMLADYEQYFKKN